MTRLQILVTIALVIAALIAGSYWLNRPLRIAVTAVPPPSFPQDGFSHQSFESLLASYIGPSGRLDYSAWHASSESVAALESYLGAVSRFSPDTTPERFEGRDEELVYWIQSYNAYVIKSALDNWPIESVTDLKAPIEVIKGMGFFHRLRFPFGAEYYSLLEVENQKIRKRFNDARVHFVLNCGAESCPILRPGLPTNTELESMLSKAATDFVGDVANVQVDHDKHEIVLSSIFKWYRKDFINDLRRRGLPIDRGLIDYVASVAPTELGRELDLAAGYSIHFSEYDWSLNDSSKSPAPAAKPGQ